MGKQNNNLVEYETWVLMCLRCGKDLAVDGRRPGHGWMIEHFAEHDIPFRPVQPATDGYTWDHTFHPLTGEEDHSATSIYALDHGKGEQVLMAVRMWGKVLASEKPQEALV